MWSKLLFTFLVSFAFQSMAADCTSDLCTVAGSGGETRVLKHGKCYTITNNGSKSIMVPAKTSNELTSFINATIPNVTKTPCIAYVASTHDVHSGNWTSNCTTNKPSGLQVGDLIILYIYEYDYSSPPALTPPSGFTAIGSMLGPQCSNFYSQVYYKIATATEVAASTLGVTRNVGTFNNCGVMASVYRGVDSTSPFVGIAKNTGSSTTATFNSVTTTKADSLSIALAESCAGVPSTPAGYTSNYSSSDLYTRISSKIIPSVGATGSFTAGSGGSGQWATTHIIFNSP